MDRIDPACGDDRAGRGNLVGKPRLERFPLAPKRSVPVIRQHVGEAPRELARVVEEQAGECGTRAPSVDDALDVQAYLRLLQQPRIAYAAVVPHRSQELERERRRVPMRESLELVVEAAVLGARRREEKVGEESAIGEREV